MIAPLITARVADPTPTSSAPLRPAADISLAQASAVTGLSTNDRLPASMQ